MMRNSVVTNLKLAATVPAAVLPMANLMGGSVAKLMVDTGKTVTVWVLSVPPTTDCAIPQNVPESVSPSNSANRFQGIAPLVVPVYASIPAVAENSGFGVTVPNGASPYRIGLNVPRN